MTTDGSAAVKVETEPKKPSIFDKPTSAPISLDISAVYTARRAATPPAESSTVAGSFLFVILIGVAVAAAGFIGIAVWGPETKAPSRGATDTQLTPSFSLPTAAPSMMAPAVATAEPTPPPAEASAGSESHRPAKKGKPPVHAPRATGRPKG